MKAGPIEERFSVVIMREVLIALAYLHKEAIIHRDIKGMTRQIVERRHCLTPASFC